MQRHDEEGPMRPDGPAPKIWRVTVTDGVEERDHIEDDDPWWA